jgi:hypothetical protein
VAGGQRQVIFNDVGNMDYPERSRTEERKIKTVRGTQKTEKKNSKREEETQKN